MFLKTNSGRKGNIVAQFVVLLIIAVLMIFVVTSFGAKIWKSFFPNDDKSILQSFNTLFVALNARSVSPLDYDSVIMTTYLGENYVLALFDDTKKLHCTIQTEVTTMLDGDGKGGSSRTITEYTMYNAPTKCIAGKPCLCLYSAKPDMDIKNKDKNVIKCSSLQKNIDINTTLNDINKRLCYSSVKGNSLSPIYQDFILAKKTDKISNTESYSQLYVMSANDANKKLNDEWKVPLCTNDNNDLCYGKRDKSVFTPVTDLDFLKVYTACTNNNPSYKSTSVTCNYNLGKQGCDTICSTGDITEKCANYQTCEGMNVNTDVWALTYLNNITNREEYYMFNNDEYYCNLGCKIYQWDVYINKQPESESGGIYCNSGVECKIGPCDMSKMKLVEYFDELTPNLKTKTGGYLFMVQNGDTSTECTDYIRNNYYSTKYPMMACIKDNYDCKTFVLQKKVDCKIKYINYGKDVYWITYYDPSCELDVKAFFDVAYKCVDKE